jgi:DNA repair exonuclease SbcCD ATPase subunit
MSNTAQELQAPQDNTWDISPIQDIEQQLKDAKKRYAKVPDFNTKVGYQAGKKAIRELTSLRTSTDKARLAITKPHREFVDKVNQRGKGLIGEVEQLEKPFRDSKAEVDEREEREKERRIADLRQKLQEDITAYLDTAVGLDAQSLESLLQEVEQKDTQGYYDITQEAEDELARVTHALRDRLEYTREQERLAAEREEIERQKAELQKMRAEVEPATPAGEAPAWQGDDQPFEDDAPEEPWTEALEDLQTAGELDASQAVAVLNAIQAGDIRHITTRF